MTETEFPRVQHLPRKFVRKFWSVDLVAQHGMADVMKMDANLVRASAMQGAFHHALSATGMNDTVRRLRGAPARWHHRHLLPMHAVAPDRRVDHADVFLKRARHHREINFLHFARCKLLRQILMREIVFRDHDTAARFLVEPMHDAGPFFSTDPGKIRAVRQERVDQRMCSRFPRPDEPPSPMAY